MDAKQYAENLRHRLIEAARRRNAEGVEIVEGKDFEKFILAVDRIGALTERLAEEKVDMAHIGMALDFYHRAVALELGVKP